MSRMLSITVASLITFLLVSSGNSIQSSNTELTKYELEHKMDTKTLLDMLAKFMNVLGDKATKSQISIPLCLSGGLTLTEMEELLNSLTTNSSRFFIISSDGRVFKEDLEHNLYIRLFSAYNRQLNHPTDIWLNKVPCRECINLINGAFISNRNKPIIHLETVSFNETDFESMMRSLGCLAKLRPLGFSVTPWNWDTFTSFLTTSEHTNCLRTILTATTDFEYIEKKALIENILTIIHELPISSSIIDWCS